MADYQRALRLLQDVGLLLLSDTELASVSGLVAGEPVRGSWWGHPRGQEIFRVSEKLANHADVTTAKLVSKKVTFVHRKLWPALMTVGISRDLWQLKGLSRAARSFLGRIEREGQLRTDGIRIAGGRQKVGDMARELEKRLLAHTQQVHTESGAHAKALESWEHWAQRVGVEANRLTVEQSKRQIEKAAERLLSKSGGPPPEVPWSYER